MHNIIKFTKLTIYYSGLIKAINAYHKGTDMNAASMTIKYNGLESFSYALI